MVCGRGLNTTCTALHLLQRMTACQVVGWLHAVHWQIGDTECRCHQLTTSHQLTKVRVTCLLANSHFKSVSSIRHLLLCRFLYVCVLYVIVCACVTHTFYTCTNLLDSGQQEDIRDCSGRYWSKSALFRTGWVTLSASCGWKGTLSTNLCWYRKTGVITLLFVTKHECDRRTDGQNYDRAVISVVK